MTLERVQTRHYFCNRAGPLPGVEVTITDENGEPAIAYAGPDGAELLEDPHLTGPDAILEAWLEPGAYVLEVPAYPNLGKRRITIRTDLKPPPGRAGERLAARQLGRPDVRPAP